MGAYPVRRLDRFILDRLAFELPDAGGCLGLEGGAFISDRSGVSAGDGGVNAAAAASCAATISSSQTLASAHRYKAGEKSPLLRLVTLGGPFPRRSQALITSTVTP
jgi:hypothetical protein